MKKLVESLPVRSETNKGTLIMKDVNVDDTNECMKEDVQKAQEKYWTLYSVDDEMITPYPGIENSIDMNYAQKMSVVEENGNMEIYNAKPHVAYQIFTMDGIKVGEGVTDRQGNAQRQLNAYKHQRLIVKVSQCGTVKL